MSALPAGWVMTCIADIALFNPKTIAEDSLKAAFAPMQFLGTRYRDRMAFEERPWGEIKKAYVHFQPRDVIVAKVTPCFENGKAGVAPPLPNSIGAGSSEFCVFRPAQGVDERYLLAWLSTEDFRRRATVAMTGSVGLKRVPKEVFLSEQIPLAPEAEQKRIADKLDTVLTRVDAVNTRLARVAPLLKRFRQSVLAAATSGRLTEDWRIANPSINAQSWLDEVSSKSKTSSRRKPLEPSLADLSKTVQLPETWTVTGLDSLAADKPHALKAGPFGSALKKSMYVSRGYKIYGQEQVIAGDETVGEYFIDDEKFAELKACAVESGDILISLVGTIGRVLVLSPDALPGIINPRLVKLSLHPEVNRSYFSLYLRSPIALSFFEGNSHGGTMDILNLGILRNLPLLIPPPAEQTEIVRRVETLFAFADRLEARLAQAQTAATRLTPALLAKAFRGELVPQDPNDEPAAELLRRLASNPTVPPKRGRAAKAT